MSRITSLIDTASERKAPRRFLGGFSNNAFEAEGGLPEGWLDSVLNDRDERATLRSGKRYMSNITVVENKEDLATLPQDILLTRLDQYARNGVFTGTYAGPGRDAMEESFERNLARMLAMPDGMPPALLVERFDVRVGNEDRRLLALEDLCSVLDLPPEAKYTGTMERIARAVRALSTAAEDDVLLVLKRALFAWLIADGDMHLKNMALLKTAEPGSETFRSARLADGEATVSRMLALCRTRTEEFG